MSQISDNTNQGSSEINAESPTVSIIIKALNEERHVAAAIEGALTASSSSHGRVLAHGLRCIVQA
jgi:hypothetical protein